LVTQFVSALYPWVSRDRLEAYRPYKGTDLEMVVNYLFNTALSEALYTSLGFLEVTLRNSLHETIATYYRRSNWYDRPGVLEQYQADDVTKAKRRIAGLGKGVVPGRVVAELNFGFWVSLLSGAYDRRFWWPNQAQLLKSAFPNIPSNLRQRKTIYARYNSLRELRNRVMHHEPIWNRPTLAQDYQHVYEAIGWISPDMAVTAQFIDRFPDILVYGQRRIEVKLKSHFGIS
jgi:hypothetical protein